MRWFISLVIAALIGVLAWFIYPRIVSQEVASPLNSLPESTWAITHITPSNIGVFTDTNRLLMQLLPDSIQKGIQVIGTSEGVWCFLYEASSQIEWGVILENSAPHPELEKSLPHAEQVLGYTFRYSSAIETTEARTKIDLTLFPNHSSTTLSVALKPFGCLRNLLPSASASLYNSLSAQFLSDDWVAIEVEEDGSIFRAYGIESRNAASPSENSIETTLLQYLPSSSGAAIVQAGDSISTALAYCPYQLDDTTSERNLFVFIQFSDEKTPSMELAQEYQGIPIGIQALPANDLQLKPEWHTEAFTAQLSQHVWVFGESFEALANLIEDYLADDRLTLSPYFTPLDRYVSDASFTLFMRPDLLKRKDAYLLNEPVEAPINTLIYQSFEELPQQQFHALTALHHQEIKDIAPLAWSLRLDTLSAAGPWSFKNHYTNAPEILVQDHKNQLYLINEQGKTLWKKQLDGRVNETILTIDAFSNNKLQLVFSTPKSLYFVDRNGNNVKGFPVKLDKPSTAAPLCVKYSKKSDYRFIVNSGENLVNIDPEGKTVKGWTNPNIEGNLLSAVDYCYFNGKDYLIARSSAGKIHIFDRAGKKRASSFSIDTSLVHLEFREGKSFNTSYYQGYDKNGNLIAYSLSGKESKENLLPLGEHLGVRFTSDVTHAIITVKDDRIITLNEQHNVGLDFLMPEALSPSIDWLSEDRSWIGLSSREGMSYYILDLQGRMLDKMPLEGSGPALVMDLDKNGSYECILSNGKGLIQAYKLAD